MEFEHITAFEFLELQAKARQNNADKIKLDRLKDEVKSLPHTQERLTFEFLALVNQALEKGTDPEILIYLATFWNETLNEERLLEYSVNLEKIVFRCFELLGQLSKPRMSEVQPFYFALNQSLRTLRKVDRRRFDLVVDILRKSIIDEDQDQRATILNEIAMTREQRLRAQQLN